MKEIVSRVEISTALGAGWIDAASLAFGYRTASLPPGGVITRVEVTLRDGDAADSARVMQADLERRRRTQPLGQPTFGSTFRNPPGDSAGRLIEAVGLKGHRIGGAAWSDIHANFVVNLGGATSADVVELIRLAKKRVEESFGITLEPEVRFVGEFSDSRTR
jgi:UDP-N-acetylmuramate dehydrogenase